MLQIEPQISKPQAPQILDPVLHQVAVDLNEALSKSEDPKKELKNIAKKTGIHSKTLTRIIRFETKPSHLTVFKIYQYLTGGQSEEEVLSRSPELIRKYLPKDLKVYLQKEAICNPHSLSQELESNPVMAEIYALCAAGLVSEDEILKRFGSYGMQITYDLVGKKALQQSRKGVFTIGTNSIFLTPECILSLGLLSTKNYAKPKNGYLHEQHFMGYISEGLSDEGYKKWIQIDIEAYQKKSLLVKDTANLGTKKAFSFQIVETFQLPEAE